MMASAWIQSTIASVCFLLILSLISVKTLSADAGMGGVCFRTDLVGLCHCTQPLPVLPNKPDFQPPIILNCPSGLTVNVTDGNSTNVNWTPPTATDNSGVVTLTSDYNPRDLFPIGTTAVTYTATDASGHTATCSFNITVVDTQPPVIYCPPDVTEFTDSWTPVDITWVPPTATDNSGVVNLTSDNNPGDLFPNGTTTVTYTATDAASGNIAHCSFDVTVIVDLCFYHACENGATCLPDLASNVQYTCHCVPGFSGIHCENDTQPPVISDCPSDISEYTDSRNAVSITWAPPHATDNSGVVTLTSNYDPADLFPNGTKTVTYTARDASGNTAKCSFDVTVLIDATGPPSHELDGWVIIVIVAVGVLLIVVIACSVYMCIAKKRKEPNALIHPAGDFVDGTSNGLDNKGGNAEGGMAGGEQACSDRNHRANQDFTFGDDAQYDGGKPLTRVIGDNDTGNAITRL